MQMAVMAVVILSIMRRIQAADGYFQLSRNGWFLLAETQSLGVSPRGSELLVGIHVQMSRWDQVASAPAASG